VIREWIDAAAAQRGSAPYLRDGSGRRVLSYAGLRRAARRWAAALEAAGIPPGTGVTVRRDDPVEYAARLLSIVAAGRVAVPLDPVAPLADVARVLAVARPVAAVADDAEGLPPGLALVPPPSPGTRGAAAPAAAAPGTGGPGTGGIFLCTSGTTGAPKGILLGEAQLTHVAASVATCHRLGPADHGYCPLPLFHVNAEVVGLLATLRARACLTVEPRFSRRGLWDILARQRITWINAVPAIITVLALDPPGRLPRSVRFARSASAPLPRAALARFEAAFGVPVIETYGMTEAASMITASPLHGPRKPGSAGLPAGAQV
jgi:acyl-CoA synthetase (AMP-forming)/AMP-acid ligase II